MQTASTHRSHSQEHTVPGPKFPQKAAVASAVRVQPMVTSSQPVAKSHFLKCCGARNNWVTTSGLFYPCKHLAWSTPTALQGPHRHGWRRSSPDLGSHRSASLFVSHETLIFFCQVYAKFMQSLCKVYAKFMQSLCKVYAKFMHYLCICSKQVGGHFCDTAPLRRAVRELGLSSESI